MADKPLQLINGRITEVEGTVISAGAGNAGEVPALDATGKLDPSVMPAGIGADTISVEASENLTAGNFVNIFDNGASPTGPQARKADAAVAGKESDGFVLANVTAGQMASVFHEGSNTMLSGLVIGSRYYLSDTPGGVTLTPVVGSGKVHQYIGRATLSTRLAYEADEGIILA